MRYHTSHKGAAYVPGRRGVVIAALMAALFMLSGHVLAGAARAVNDNQSPPYMGVWEPMYQGTGATDAFGKWLNRRAMFPVVTQYSMDGGGWPVIDRWLKIWLDPQWGKWVAEVPGRRAVIVLPIPTDSPSLEKGAKGKYNEVAAGLATYFVANNLGNSIICMGLINTPNTWDAAKPSDVANFVLYWRQIVTAMRAVPGGEKLQFDWVGMNRKTSFPIESAYPGDAYVDYVGMILYDQCLDKSIYPYPANATDDEKLERQKKAWSQYYHPASENGLDAWMGVAKAHGKPFSIPLWCLYSDHYADGTLSTGGDNTYFIQQMYSFIQDPANDVYFASYMDIYEYCTKISPADGYTSNYPKSVVLFQQLFGLPASATQAVNPKEKP